MPTLSVHAICATLTERLLLMLGWDKVKPLRASVYKDDSSYQELQKVNSQLRKRLQKKSESKTSGASWEQDTPKLRPVPIATPQPQTTHNNAWSSDGTAFDAAATGTV